MRDILHTYCDEKCLQHAPLLSLSFFFFLFVALEVQLSFTRHIPSVRKTKGNS